MLRERCGQVRSHREQKGHEGHSRVRAGDLLGDSVYGPPGLAVGEGLGVGWRGPPRSVGHAALPGGCGDVLQPLPGAWSATRNSP